MLHEKIGKGLFFNVYSRPESSKVIKVARFGRAINNRFGEAFRLRMQHDFKQVESRLKDHAISAKVKVFNKFWVTTQPKLDKIEPLDSTNVTPEFREQALKIINLAKEIDQETGFLFDFLGSESWKYLFKYIFTNYWALPGLLVVNKELKTIDHNLIWSGKRTKHLKDKIKSGEIKKESLIPIIEPITYYIGQVGIWLMKRKMEKQILNN